MPGTGIPDHPFDLGKIMQAGTVIPYNLESTRTQFAGVGAAASHSRKLGFRTGF